MWYWFNKIIGFCWFIATNSSSNFAFSFRNKSCLLDYEIARDAGASGFKKSRSNYQKYSPNERYNIGKHAWEFGTASTLQSFKAEFPQLMESTVRSIRSKYEEELKVALKQKRKAKSTLPVGQHGRPLMTGRIDLMVQNYLRVRYVSNNRLILCP